MINYMMYSREKKRLPDEFVFSFFFYTMNKPDFFALLSLMHFICGHGCMSKRERKKIERTASAAKLYRYSLTFFFLFSYLLKSITQNMPPFIYLFAIVLFSFVIKIESSYYVYTYDDGQSDDDDDEHCCLVRLGEKFCLAKPLTRSLVQVNKECQRLGANEKDKNYLNQIVRRLNVETSKKFDEKILIQLKNPLEKNLLNDDLVCLSAANNNINLEKCYVEFTVNEHKKQSEENFVCFFFILIV